MKTFITLPALLAAALFSAAGPAQAQDTSCILTNGKTVAIHNIGAQPVYTYGNASKVELTLPVAGAADSRVFKGSQMFSGGASTYMRFTNGAYSYVAYNGIGKGWEYVGLLVYKGQKLIMHRDCKPGGGELLSGMGMDDIHAPEDQVGDFVGPPS